jgi:hypothetical protein
MTVLKATKIMTTFQIFWISFLDFIFVLFWGNIIYIYPGKRFPSSEKYSNIRASNIVLKLWLSKFPKAEKKFP